jgi:hypothetical protein
MNATILFATLAMFLPPQGPPLQTGPLRNSFLVAAESVVDNSQVIDPNEPSAQFDPQMRVLKQSETILKSMAQDERETGIASDSFNMVFSVSACHIEARDANKSATCKEQINHSINEIMTEINHHKQNGTWVEGPPAS